MTPTDVLRGIERYGAAFDIPDVYRGMSRALLADLAEELGKSSLPATLPADPDRREARYATPARRRAAFLRHLARCRTVIEAAARTGVDRRTVNRWRAAFPAFDARCEEITTERRREALEAVVMAADHVEVRPILYRGRRVGQHTKRDRTLGLYLLKQADAQALRAEQRREREVEARLDAAIEAGVANRPVSRSERRAPAAAEAVRSSPVDVSTAGHGTSGARATVAGNVPALRDLDIGKAVR